MDWLRSQMKGTEIIRSAARISLPLTVLTAVHSRASKRPKAFSALTRSAFWALRQIGLFVRSVIRLYLPAPLGSTIVTRFFATMGALTPERSFLPPSVVPEFTSHRLPSIQSPTTPNSPPDAIHSLHAVGLFCLGFTFRSQARQSPWPNRVHCPLLTAVLCYRLLVPFPLLSTRGYRPDAVTFRYWPAVSARSGLSPLCPCALFGARAAIDYRDDWPRTGTGATGRACSKTWQRGLCCLSWSSEG